MIGGDLTHLAYISLKVVRASMFIKRVLAAVKSAATIGMFIAV